MDEQIRKALEQNNFGRAFELLEQAGTQPDAVLHIKADYNALLAKQIVGTITDEEFDVMRARIRGRMLGLSNPAQSGGGRAGGSGNCPVEVFLAYAQGDEGFTNELVTFMNPAMIFNRRIKLTKMQELDLGNRAGAALDEAMKKAGIALLLVTPRFAGNSECFQASEKAMELYEERGLKVVPIKVANADMRWLPFNELLSLPSRLPGFVAEWGNRDAAFVHVVERIGELVASMGC